MILFLRGEYGEVWKAFDCTTRKVVAVKFVQKCALREQGASDWKEVDILNA
jgi:hypothetical protein